MDDFILTLLHDFFLFDPFLEARAEILTKISLVFLVNFETQKGNFEIKLTFQIQKSENR